MQEYETIAHNGYTITTYYDDDPQSPREWDNLGKMVLKHSRYNFPQDISIDFDDFANWEEVTTYLEKEYDAVVILPVQMYEHSGVSIYVGNSHDKWDGGQLGLVFATREDVLKNFMVKRLTKDVLKRATECLTSEVETYSAYVDGEVYRYETVDPNGDDFESCGGYYGDDYAYMVTEAKSQIDTYESLPPSKKAKHTAAYASALHR